MAVNTLVSRDGDTQVSQHKALRYDMLFRGDRAALAQTGETGVDEVNLVDNPQLGLPKVF
jgi:hypothetical protein